MRNPPTPLVKSLLPVAKMIVTVLAAAALRFLLNPALAGHFPFILFIPALVLVTWRWGLALGLSGAALSALCIGFWRFLPQPQFHPTIQPQTLQITLFLAVAGATVLVVAKLVAVAKKLAVSERRYKSLVRSSGGFVWITDATGVSQVRPDQWETVTGRSDYKQGDWAALIDPEDLKTVQARFKAAGIAKQSYEAEFRMRSKDGTYRWFATRAVPILGEDGQIVEWVGLTYDIHVVKLAGAKLEAAVAERTAELRTTLDEMESFSYSVSHDLRGPLRVMQSFAEALAEDCGDDLSALGKDYIRRIVSAADRMDRVIQDVLAYSRVTRGELALEPVDLNDFIASLLESYPNFSAAKADIAIDGRLPRVVGNQAALTQALSNLIGNAIKFVAPGVRPEVRIFARTAAGRAFVSIRDNGIGIPAEARDAIFGLFYRVDHSYAGTGIGLATARKAVERMSGRLTVESEPGRGSTFTFDLALAEPAAVDLTSVSPRNGRLSS